MKSKLLGLLCIAVLCTILTLGLWPFHSPKNDVTWLKDAGGLSLGRFGSIQSSGVLKTASSTHGLSGSIEVWVQPVRWSSSATVLAFYEAKSGRLFKLLQSLTDLQLEVEVQGTEARLYVDNGFSPALHEKKPVFVTVAYGPGGTAVYRDGALAESSPRFRIPQDAFTGEVIVGDSPRQPDSFRGLIRGLAIYDVELASPQVSRHYLTWTKSGHPDITQDERNTALYLFDEKAGAVIHNRAASGVDLHIPESYTVVNKIFMEPIWEEFDMSWSYWKSNLENVIGFLPVGFVFYAYFLNARPIRRAMLVTIAVGTATSLTIEVLQVFLPTRDSGTTDLITNTFGTYLGILCYTELYPLLTKRFPWLSYWLDWLGAEPHALASGNKLL